MTEKCDCGEPLHYQSEETRRVVQMMIDERGPTIRVQLGDEAFMVPRHFIALHGLSASAFTVLASRYGWKAVK